MVLCEVTSCKSIEQKDLTDTAHSIQPGISFLGILDATERQVKRLSCMGTRAVPIYQIDRESGLPTCYATLFAITGVPPIERLRSPP